jgi:hypothetical protein
MSSINRKFRRERLRREGTKRRRSDAPSIKWLFLMLVLVALIIVIVEIFNPGAGRPTGRVWSPEHGHWH